MAKPAAKTPSSSNSHTTLRVLALVVLVAVVAAGLIAAWAEWRLRTAEGDLGADDLDAAVRAQSRSDDQRLEELSVIAARLALWDGLPTSEPGNGEDPEERLRTLVGSLQDVLDEHQVDLIVLRGGGELALGVGEPDGVAQEIAVSELMGRALDEGSAQGVWSLGERLYRIAAARVESDGETVGAIAVADLVARSTAIEARAASRAEAVYVLDLPEGGEEAGGPRVIAKTLDDDGAGRVLAELGSGGALAGALEGRGRTGPVDLRLPQGSYRAVATPLGPAPDGSPGAARVTLLETGAGVGRLRMVQAAALLSGLLALLLGVLGAPLVTRGAGASSKEVEEAAAAARAGDLAGAARRGVPAPLAAYFQEAAEKRALEGVVASLGRSGAGSGSTGGSAAASERRKGAVLAVEMPRYARIPPDQDPKEVSERLGRDLARVRRAVTARDGRLEAALGHRALAVFEGERAGARALGAGAEILEALSTPENAFDEPVPPAVAVATGGYVSGGPEGARTVAGLPVQQAESLLREASSGDLIVAKKAFRDLEEELGAAGVTVTPQRGLLSPQPVYLLDAGKAARAAEALGSAPGAVSSSAGALANLAPGVVVGERFTLLERREANPAWIRYLARDGETDARVTLRALRPGAVLGTSSFQEFDGPLQAVQRVVDPAVERVLAAGGGEEGDPPFLAAEWVEGPTLEGLLDRLRRERQPLPAAAALRVARSLATGLTAIHGARVPHGALRPAAVALDPRGHARLAELGLALALPVPGIDEGVDRVLGPERYRAPERRAGGDPTPAADVYAAGVLLTELFSGRIAEDGDPPEAPDATELPDGLAPVLARCLAHDPADRYPDGAALAEALTPIRAELISP